MCAWLNIKCITSITIVVSIDVEGSLCIAYYVNRRNSYTATVGCRTKTVVWEVPKWLHTCEFTVSVSKLVECESRSWRTNYVGSSHEEEVFLTYLELNKTVVTLVHRDSITRVIPYLSARRNVDEVVDKKSTFFRFTIEQHWQCVETVNVEE